MVRATFSGFSANPGAKTLTTKGIAISNKMINKIKIKVKNEMALAANLIDSSLPDATSLDENSGTKAEVKAPSANKLLNKFGNLNDTKNASEILPAPKKLAISISRINPVMRLIIVKPPKVAMERIKDIFFPIKNKFDNSN
jgi:hypothetical protein